MRRAKLFFFVICTVLGVTGCFNKITDYSDSVEFAPLVGLCLKCRTEMTATPYSSGDYSLSSRSTSFSKQEVDRGYWKVPAGSSVVIDKIEYLKSFDGHYLFISGELTSTDGRSVRASLANIIDEDWRWEARKAIMDGVSVPLDPNHLPIRWEYVSLCSDN
ncbi:MAG: hypothetical protein DRJ61_14890 [Acidobacteria bacterium]|nr:MAG: hypothetical protein DRJ65_07615 [Acidobacteriota bacterium]RLE29291.1 MAG: hypothetical protein DRJ61_14890 [Acidobacteriota bacterium]